MTRWHTTRGASAGTAAIRHRSTVRAARVACADKRGAGHDAEEARARSHAQRGLRPQAEASAPPAEEGDQALAGRSRLPLPKAHARAVPALDSSAAHRERHGPAATPPRWARLDV